MLRRLAGGAIALALLAPTPFAASGPAGAAPAPESATADTDRPITRDVRLGHPPVRYANSQRPAVRLRFHATKGRLIELASWSKDTDANCFRRTLRREGGRRVAPWATGHWRLPRTGAYTAVLRPCDELQGRFKVQVRRAVVQDVSLDGPVIQVGANPDVTHLYRARLTEGEQLSVRPSRWPRHLVLPSGKVAEYLPSGPILLGAGADTHWADGPGTYYVAARPGSTLSVTRALGHAATLDGATVSLANAGIDERAHVVSFEARAGQWVYPVLLDSAGVLVPAGRARVLPTGVGSESWVITACPGQPTSVPCYFDQAGPWLIPADGTYRMSVIVAASAPSDTFSFRVRSAAVAPALTLDGPVVTYTSTTPGQWVVGPYTEGLQGTGDVVTAGNASAELSDWRLTLASGYRQVCAPNDRSNGCGYYSKTSLTPQRPSLLAPSDGNVGPSVVVLAVPPDVRGSLEVRLSSQ